MAHRRPVSHQRAVEHVIEMGDERNLCSFDALNFATVNDLPDSSRSNYSGRLDRILDAPNEASAGSQDEGAIAF